MADGHSDFVCLFFMGGDIRFFFPKSTGYMGYMSSQSCKHTAATNVQPKLRAKLLHASGFRTCFGAFFE